MSSFFKETYEKLPKSGVINVYGPQGCGKTFFFSKLQHVSFSHDVLKTKEKTGDFMKMMKCSLLPLVLDDFDIVSSLPGVKELVKIKTQFFIVSENKIDLDIITCHFEFPNVPIEEFAKENKIDIQKAKQLIEKSSGNLTTAKTDIDSFVSVRDVFIDSKDYVKELIRSEKPSEFIDRHLSEHGNTFGMIHENYPEYTDEFTKVTQSLSDAVLIDQVIYSEVSWDLMPFFNVSGCIIPAFYMKGNPEDIKPGSAWTKHSNMCMKMSRLRKLRIPREHLWVWALKANAGEKINFEDSYDLDSINQISFIKIKPKILTSLKKSLKI